MEIIAPIALMLILIKPDGNATIDMHPQATSEQCWAAARRFIMRNPAEFGAIAIGAGCVVHPDGRGAHGQN